MILVELGKYDSLLFLKLWFFYDKTKNWCWITSFDGFIYKRDKTNKKKSIFRSCASPFLTPDRLDIKLRPYTLRRYGYF